MANETDLALRSRYYQSIADTTLLKHGQRYSDLKELYIIFLCNGDFVGENEVVAHAETIFSHSGRRLNDKVHKMAQAHMATAQLCQNKFCRNVRLSHIFINFKIGPENKERTYDMG